MPLVKAAFRRRIKQMSFLATPWGEVCIAEQGGAICDVFQTRRERLIGATLAESDLLGRAKTEIGEYLAGTRYSFDLPLLLEGSDFQRAVLSEVLRIPYGQTRSYRQVAEDIGHPRAARAVGTANRHCRLLFLIPCHRVIRSDGSVAGAGEDECLRGRLLDLEARYRPERRPRGPASS